MRPIAVFGPTASGKSALGLALAHELDGEVVNGDALQFYRGMDVGTAKVTQAEREGVPHHQLDVLDVGQEASVAAFQSAARDLFDQIRARGRTPILVGGSGLYVRAALDVLEFPPTDPEVRAAVEAESHLDQPRFEAFEHQPSALIATASAWADSARVRVRAPVNRASR